jgi:hypothetical protein
MSDSRYETFLNDYGLSEHDEISLEFRSSFKDHYDLEIYSESSISGDSGDDSGESSDFPDESGADSNEIDDDSDDNYSENENTKRSPPDFIDSDYINVSEEVCSFMKKKCDCKKFQKFKNLL